MLVTEQATKGRYEHIFHLLLLLKLCAIAVM